MAREVAMFNVGGTDAFTSTVEGDSSPNETPVVEELSTPTELEGITQ